MQDLSEQLRGITEGVGGIVPELIITAGILVLLVVGLFKTRSNALFASIALVTSACSLYILAQDFSPSSAFFSGMLRREGFGHFLMMLVDVSVALTCLMSLTAPGPEKRSEYYSLLLTVSLGSHFLLMTTHLVMVFLSLEVISISMTVTERATSTMLSPSIPTKYSALKVPQLPRFKVIQGCCSTN